jgi:hypothetical protein
LIQSLLEKFFAQSNTECRKVESERGLQLELAYFLRKLGVECRFEVEMGAPSLAQSNRRPKTYLDLLVGAGEQLTAIELKVPLQGRHPETMYDFCADIEFVESIVRAKKAVRGIALLVTNDRAFWSDSGRGSEIHNLFRQKDMVLSGKVVKPTGLKDSVVCLEGSYELHSLWADVENQTLIRGARRLLVSTALM